MDAKRDLEMAQEIVTAFGALAAKMEAVIANRQTPDIDHALGDLVADLEWYDTVAIGKDERDRAHHAILADARHIVAAMKRSQGK